jgi:3-methylcrotonyl-CoA carboxylase alpha subunit
MFKKILIANRGEIAVRIMATCREMGIRTVAVYSEADRLARHVREADEAYYLGPAPATQSYLCIDKIIEIARACQAEAIHPGYGFLSENADFAEACTQAGIVFIGPPASAMRLMGSKIAAKRLAQSVGAPTVPGYDGERQDDNTLLEAAQSIGFPLLIKASAGGGGKGMRTVTTAQDFLEQLAAARREAHSAFGDATVFLERLIQRPRHVEIQVLGDTHEHMLHLCERECSIQRRHQKILEESPSTALTPELRATMGATAVRIAQAAHYVNAGTMEFMLDDDKQFYFLEMNTRLQVEHPVTELVTGLDLVRHQLRIAAGEALDLTQGQISQRGHAIEVRIYAEDPVHDFLPSPGTISRFHVSAGPGIRIDSGVEQGDEISQYYDPMIAKLIVYGEDRYAAIARLRTVLEHSAILGVTTNIPLLHAISVHPSFQTGQTNTDFLSEYKLLDSKSTQSQHLPSELALAAALYEVVHERTQAAGSLASPSLNHPASPWQTLGPWRMIGEARTITYHWHNQEYKVSLSPHPDVSNTWNVRIGDTQYAKVAGTAQADGTLLIQYENGSQQRVSVQVQPSVVLIAYYGQIYQLQRQQPPDIEVAAHRDAGAHAQKTLIVPMAGTIVKVQVHPGEEVEANQVLVILSAMKMEHSIIAPYAGVVQRVLCQEGDVVPGGAAVVEME